VEPPHINPVAIHVEEHVSGLANAVHSGTNSTVDDSCSWARSTWSQPTTMHSDKLTRATHANGPYYTVHITQGSGSCEGRWQGSGVV
jgi:hypothetical protein